MLGSLFPRFLLGRMTHWSPTFSELSLCVFVVAGLAICLVVAAAGTSPFMPLTCERRFSQGYLLRGDA